MIRTEELWFGYAGGRDVLNGLTLAFPAGFTAVIGPNAAGKSTLLKCLFGLLTPRGRVFCRERLLSGLPRQEWLDSMAYMPQTENCEVSLTVFEMVLLGRLPQLGWRVEADDLNAVMAALRQLHISRLAERRLDELSGGQQKLVAIAQMLVRQPAVVLMDEPTNSLDLQKQLELCALIKTVSTGRPVSFIVVLHDINLAARFADHIVVMAAGGTAYACGAPQAVITEQMLLDVYGVRAHVARDGSGIPVISPVCSVRAPDSGC